MPDRGLTAAVVAELAKGKCAPIVLVEGEFATATVNFWSGVGELSWDGKTWTGAGELGGISRLAESSEAQAEKLQVSLSGIPTTLVNFVLSETRRGKPLRVWIGFLTEAGAVIADPKLAFTGRIDGSAIEDNGETSTITLTVESHLVDLNRNEELRYTHQSQQSMFPGDEGFKYVESIQNLNLVWGRGAAPPVGGGGGGGGSRDRGERLFQEPMDR